jgi:hypothetical protein
MRKEPNGILTDGNWELTISIGFGFGYYIRHECHLVERYCRAWCENRYFQYPCPECNEYVPDGLQAMFVFMTGT